jgi:hypothetical protein
MIFATQVCGQWTSSFSDQPINQLFGLDNFIESANACQVGQYNSINNTQTPLSTNFTNATGSLQTLSGGATGTFGISSFIDVIKLIFPILSLLLGIPLYTFLFTVGLPYVVAVSLTVFLATLYVIGWMEFIRGGNL